MEPLRVNKVFPLLSSNGRSSGTVPGATALKNEKPANAGPVISSLGSLEIQLTMPSVASGVPVQLAGLPTNDGSGDRPAKPVRSNSKIYSPSLGVRETE